MRPKMTFFCSPAKMEIKRYMDEVSGKYGDLQRHMNYCNDCNKNITAGYSQTSAVNLKPSGLLKNSHSCSILSKSSKHTTVGKSPEPATG